MEEKRTLPRWDVGNPLFYEVPGGEARMSEGLLQDINLLGVKASLSTKADIHSRVRLVMRMPGQVDSISAEGEVIWQNTSQGAFTTGIRFMLFKPDDKQRLLEHFSRQAKQNWWR